MAAACTVFRLNTAVTPPAARRFLLTNPDGYSLTYNGLVMAMEKRRSNGWQAFGSYTWSKAYWAAALERHVGCGYADQHGLAAAAIDVRPRSQRSHQRARPVAERSTAHRSG